VLKHCAAHTKRWLSALPIVGPYIYDVKISGFTGSSIYVHEISRLRVKISYTRSYMFWSAWTIFRELILGLAKVRLLWQ